MDDDVEAAPIYRSDGKAGQPVIRPYKNHDLCIKLEPIQMESKKNQQTQLKAVPKFRSLDRSTQNPGGHDEHTWFVVRLRIGPVTASLKEMTDLQIEGQ